MIVLGIDPGVTGGLAWVYARGQIDAKDIPTAGGEVDVDTIVGMLKEQRPTVTFIERVHSMPKQGVASSFKFGMAYGALWAVVVASGIPLHRVSPTVWKKHFHLSADKEQARALAIQYWPGTGLFARKKDHGRAEAALIARYGLEVSLK